MPRPLLACVPLLLTCTASLADNCESVSAQIDAKIRAAGVANFTLTTVGIDDAAAGKVVGTCGLGARKIVYLAHARPAAAAASAAAAPTRRAAKPKVASDIITECRDGSMSLGGECKN